VGRLVRRRRTQARDTVDDLIAALDRLSPLTRIQIRDDLEGLIDVLDTTRPDRPKDAYLAGARHRAAALARALERAVASARELRSSTSRAEDLVLGLLQAGREVTVLASDLEIALRDTLARQRARAHAWAIVEDLDRRLAAVRGLEHDLGSDSELQFSRAILEYDVAAARRQTEALLQILSSHGWVSDWGVRVSAAMERLARAATAIEPGRNLTGVLTSAGGDLADLLNVRECRRLVDGLCRARDEFLTADLTDVDLAGIRLDGVQWTMDTRWPEACKEQVEHGSEEIGLGICQVRGGNTLLTVLA
jgi:hypothetical protein